MVQLGEQGQVGGGLTPRRPSQPLPPPGLGLPPDPADALMAFKGQG